MTNTTDIPGAETGEARAEGWVVHRGRTIATAEGPLFRRPRQAHCLSQHDDHDFRRETRGLEGE